MRHGFPYTETTPPLLTLTPAAERSCRRHSPPRPPRHRGGPLPLRRGVLGSVMWYGFPYTETTPPLLTLSSAAERSCRRKLPAPPRPPRHRSGAERRGKRTVSARETDPFPGVRFPFFEPAPAALDSARSATAPRSWDDLRIASGPQLAAHARRALSSGGAPWAHPPTGTPCRHGGPFASPRNSPRLGGLSA